MKTRTLWAIAIALLVALGACSRSENEVLRTIPADAAMVAKIDFKAILHNAGCKEEGNKWVLGSELEALTQEMKDGERDKLNDLLAALPGIDTENVFLFSYNNDPVLTCGLKHPEAIAAGLEKEYGNAVKFDGLEVYGGTFAIRDKQMWICQRTDLIANILKAAAKSSVADLGPAAETLAAQNSDIAVVTNYEATLRNLVMMVPGFKIPEEIEGCFAIYELRFDGNSAKVEGKVVTQKGNTLSIAEHMQPIGSTAFGFMPAQPLAATGMGKVDDIVMFAVKNAIPGYARAQVSQFLDAIDGSIALGVAPPADIKNLLQPELWTFTLAVQCKKNDAEQVLELLPDLAHNIEASVEQLPDQTHLCIKGGFRQRHDLNVYVGYIDGTLVASTAPISSKSNNKLAADFGNDYFASMVDAPASGEIVKELELPFGLTGEMHADSDIYRGSLTLDGSDRPFIAALIGLITDKAMHRRVGGNIGRLSE